MSASDLFEKVTADLVAAIDEGLGLEPYAFCPLNQIPQFGAGNNDGVSARLAVVVDAVGLIKQCGMNRGLLWVIETVRLPLVHAYIELPADRHGLKGFPVPPPRVRPVPVREHQNVNVPHFSPSSSIDSHINRH